MKQVVPIVVALVLIVVLSIGWGMLLESLKADNPQLADTLLVRLAPVFLVFVGYGIWKKKQQG